MIQCGVYVLKTDFFNMIKIPLTQYKQRKEDLME